MALLWSGFGFITIVAQKFHQQEVYRMKRIVALFIALGLVCGMRLPDLAATLNQIADKGAQVFYKGDIAKRIVADLQANGGLLTLNDFAGHKADWVEPISVNYRGYKAVNFPPNTQGMP